MTERLSSGGPWEELIGYSRAVRVGPTVHVSGCTSVVDGEVRHEGDAYGQAVQALQVVAAALAHFGASLDDVVRSRIYVTDISRWEEVGRAHGEAFAVARPAATMVEVSRLIDPRLLVEIEVEAWLG